MSEYWPLPLHCSVKEPKQRAESSPRLQGSLDAALGAPAFTPPPGKARPVAARARTRMAENCMVDIEVSELVWFDKVDGFGSEDI